MDVNGTRFHLLLGYGDWSGCLDADGQPLADVWAQQAASPPLANPSGLAWESSRAELTLQPRLFQFAAAPKDVPPTLEQRRGAARDRYGNWYWIDDSRQQILVNAAGAGQTAIFWPDARAACPPPQNGAFGPLQPPAAPSRLTFGGLTVTEEHYLVVGVTGPDTKGLLIFDLHAGGPPRHLFWPAAVDFAPFDMAPRPGGGVWILDRKHRRYWALDRHFTVLAQDQVPVAVAPPPAQDFQPLNGAAQPAVAPPFPGGITFDAASPLQVGDPIAIEALPDCTVLILDRNPDAPFSLIHRYQWDAPLGQAISTEVMKTLIEADKQNKFTLVAHDFAFVPEHQVPEEDGEETAATPGMLEDRLYVAAADGNQSFVFKLGQQGNQLTLDPLPEYLPMRLFGGKGVVGAATGAYYDFGNGWLPLVAQPRPRYVERAFLQTPIKDGRQPDCVWHRLLIDGCIPAETSVLIWSRAANDPALLVDDLAPWQAEPRLYRRGDGPEQPFVRTPYSDLDNSNTSTVLALPARTAGYRAGGTWELLLQRAQGRYLQLRLELRGNQRLTPRLHALRIYYPRFSYLEQYLPPLYREDERSASFLDRFLANLEGLYTTLEEKIAAVQMLFDVRSAPPQVLDWLASWFGVALDPAWDEPRRRLLIRHAMDFFQYRGTLRGLLMALRLTLDECPDERIFTEYPPREPRRGGVRIIEQYRTRRVAPVLLGDATTLSGPRLVTPTARWQPAQGGAELHRRYGEFLGAPTPVTFPLVAPADADLRSAWGRFAETVLGFTPAATAADLLRWQTFLTRRYQRISALNSAYALLPAQQLPSFSQAPLPAALPADGAPMLDWYQFESIVLAMRRTAHQFSVLVALPPNTPGANTPGDTAAQRSRLELAKRVIELEKPAHTIFDVKFFWAMFQVGAARLGEDTLLDRGSRAIDMVLGQGFLGAAFLAPGHPQHVRERQVIGTTALAT